MKYSFANDYSEGCHPKILEALNKTNELQSVGYGLDDYSLSASNKLKKLINRQDVDIHYLVGGTQTNMLVIASALKPYQAVIAVDTGHINVHETGAIEGVGHKVVTRKHHNGKLQVNDIEDILNEHSDEHMVKPKMVYISQSTEYGTCYNKQELKDIYNCCQKHHLYLFIDGARLASTLCVEDAPSLEDIANNCDVFYIGGTKSGCLLGECLVIINDDLKEDFRYEIKHFGAMLAKGRIIGLQFNELFDNDLYYQIGQHETNMAQLLKKKLIDLNIKFFIDSPTNQLFPILDNDVIETLSKDYLFVVMDKISDHQTCIRLVTSFNTTEANINDFVLDLRQIVL